MTTLQIIRQYLHQQFPNNIDLSNYHPAHIAINNGPYHYSTWPATIYIVHGQIQINHRTGKLKPNDIIELDDPQSLPQLLKIIQQILNQP